VHERDTAEGKTAKLDHPNAMNSLGVLAENAGDRHAARA